MSAEAAEAGAHKRLPAHGGGTDQEPGTTQAAGRETRGQ